MVSRTISKRLGILGRFSRAKAFPAHIFLLFRHLGVHSNIRNRKTLTQKWESNVTQKRHHRRRYLCHYLEALESRQLLSSTLLSAPNHQDVVYDPTRNQLLVVSSAGTITRFDSSGNLVGTINIGNGPIGAADISPDGQFLYLTTTTPNASNLTMDRVDLSNGGTTSFTDTTFISASAELFDVGVLSTGVIVLSTASTGVDNLDLGQFQPGDNHVTFLLNNHSNAIFQPLRVLTSADRSTLLLLEPQTGSNSSFTGGSVSLYDTTANDVTTLSVGALPLRDSTTAAINHDGSLYAIDLDTGIAIYNRSGSLMSTLTGIHGGLAFASNTDRLFVADASTDRLRVVDLSTPASPAALTQLPLGEDLTNVQPYNNGQVRISPDGSKAFVTTTTGVRVLDIPASLFASTLVLSTDSQTIQAFTNFSLDATFTDIDAGAGSTLPSGQVQFFLGNATIGSAAIVNGVASLELDTIPPGSFTFTATYDGDENFGANLSNSLAMTFTVPPVSTTTLLTSSLLSPLDTSTVTLTASVVPNTSGTPTGSVTFFDGALAIQTVNLIDGRATYSKAFAAGVHTLSASYSPTSNNNSSLSDTLTVTSTKANVIDILALYTPEALASAGSAEAIRTNLQDQIDDANAIFAAGIPVIPLSLRLVAVIPTTYTQAGAEGGLPTDLIHLSTARDGFLDDVPGLRNQYGADVVILADDQSSLDENSQEVEAVSTALTNPRKSSRVNKAFMVLALAPPRSHHLLAREMGHILGAPGDINNPTDADLAAVRRNGKVVAGYRKSRQTGSASLSGSTVTGFALDTRTLDAPMWVRIDIDNSRGTAFPADLNSSDANTLFNSPDHGFSFSIPTLSEGKHTVRVLLVDPANGKTTRLAKRTYNAPSPLFDETYYLGQHPEIIPLIQAGTYKNAWDHFKKVGQFARYNPSPYFDTAWYIAHNPSVAALDTAHKLPSPFAHYNTTGQFKGLSASPYFNEHFYRLTNSDVVTLIKKKKFKDGLMHFLLVGQYQGRNPIPYFDAAYYKTHSTYASLTPTQLANGGQSAYAHFLSVGLPGNEDASAFFRPSLYFALNPDLDSDSVIALDHYLRTGYGEDRPFSDQFSEDSYLAHNPDVVLLVQNGTFSSGFEHYIAVGRDENRPL